MKSFRAVIATFVAAVACSGTIAQQPPLRIGLLPAEDAKQMLEQFAGIADHVAKQIGRPVNVTVSQSYNVLLESLRAKQLDVLYAGGSQYAEATEQGIPVVPLAVAKTPFNAADQLGRTYYKGCVITGAASGIKDIAGLKGKNFAFVAPTSGSGGIAQRYFLRKQGINPESDFKRVIYAGEHDAVMLAVKNGKVDAGAVADVYFPRWRDKGFFSYSSYDEPADKIDSADIRILGCQRVPGNMFFARTDLGSDVVKSLKEAFQSVPRAAVQQYKVWGPTLGYVEPDLKDIEDFAAMRRMTISDGRK